jgi:hypothetical protein
MIVDLRVLRAEARRRVTSTELRRFYTHEKCRMDDFSMTIDITDTNGNRYEYTGNVLSTAQEIREKCGVTMSLGIMHEGRVRVFADDQQPLLEHIYKSGSHIKLLGLLVFIQKSRDELALKVVKDDAALRSLRRVTLTHCGIRRIPDLSATTILYLNLSCNEIDGVLSIARRLRVCDLSHNRISQVQWIEADTLNLSHNRIGRFNQPLKYQLLNLSYNHELRNFRGDARILNLSHTQVRWVSSDRTRVLYLDGTRNVRFGSLGSLRFLSMNGCGLQSLPVMEGLKVLKARNNLLRSVPTFPNLRALDLSGNIIGRIEAMNVRFLDVSKNHLFKLDLEAFGQLVHLDVSYNPIIEAGLVNIPRTLVFLNARGTGYRTHSLKSCIKSGCIRRRAFVQRYSLGLRGVLYKRLYFVVVLETELCLTNVLEQLQNSIRSTSCPHRYFDRLFSLIERLFSEAKVKAEMCLCMVTSKHVIFRGKALALCMSNFAEIRICDDPLVTYVYDNVGHWNLVPMLCGRSEAVYCYNLIDTIANHLSTVLNFIGYCCPVAYRIFISNSPGEIRGMDGVELINSVDLHDHHLLPIDEIEGHVSNAIPGAQNYNLAFNESIRRSYTSLLANPNPTFAIARFIPREEARLSAPKENAKNVVKALNRMFFAHELEFYPEYCVVIFHDKVEACLWALKLQELLRHTGMDVGVGITCGVFYTKIIGSHARFYGPVLCKAARLSHMGVGVFCCHCVWTKHGRLKYVEQGMRFMKGFSEPHMVYTPRLS